MLSKTDTNVAVINRNLKLFDVFRNLDVEMPIGQIVFFLNAAKMEGSSLRDIANASGTKMTTASRYLTNLSQRDRFKQKGLDLLQAFENPENRRMKSITLTDNGRELLRSLGPHKPATKEG